MTTYIARRLWYITGLRVFTALLGPGLSRGATVPRLGAGEAAMPWAPRSKARPDTEARTSARWSTRAGALGLIVVLAAAIASRARYILSFDGTYGSGDAHGILERAFFLREGNLSPSAQLGLSSNLLDQPPLLPAALALLSSAPGISLEVAPLILMPALTLVAVAVLYRLLARTLGLPIAVAATFVFALFPRWSFDSTEPDKGPAVVSLSILALAATEAGSRDRRFLLFGGFFMALAMMTHTTAYFFLPVVLGAHLAWNAGSIRGALSKHAVAALAFPLAALIAYVVLARQFAGAPLEGATTADATGALPSFVQTYVDAIRNLATGGFTDSAWGVYFTGIRSQLGTLLFVCALGGLALAAYEVIAEHRWQLAPYTLWAALVTLAFAIQYPAASHGSRYPGYVTPVYIVLACYFALRLGGLAVARHGAVTRRLGVCALAGIAAYAGATYALAPDPGLRDLYASHAAAASYIDDGALLDDGSAVLYMGWPSITLNILQGRPDYEDRLVTFGFGARDLTTFDGAFVREHRVKYYLYDHTGSDHYKSADVVRDMLARNMLLEEVVTFTGRHRSFATLYRLRERTIVSGAGLQGAFVEAGGSSSRNLALNNGALCPGADGAIPGWEANGVVVVEPAGSGPGRCGVLVTNEREWGGIRQTVPYSAPGQPFTTIAAVRPVGTHPAMTAVVALVAGNVEIGEASVTLEPGLNYVALEAFTPIHGQALKVVVASGPGDTGDIAIEGITITDGLLGQPAIR